MSPLEQEVRHLASLLAEAARSLGRIANHLSEAGEPAQDPGEQVSAAALAARSRAAQEQAAPPREPATAEPAADEADASAVVAGETEKTRHVEWPWEDIVRAAKEVLAGRPSRWWRPGELCRAVRDHGVQLPSLQGMHWGLVARLRQLDLIEERDGMLRHRGEEHREEWPWELIVTTARSLLDADPERRWRQAELARAVKEAGVALPRLQGMHFGLVARLRAADAIHEEDGLIRARTSTLRPGSASPPARESDAGSPPPAAELRQAPPAEPVTTDPPRSLADEPTSTPARPPRELSVDDAVAELREEVASAEPYLDTLDQQRRTAQLAIWAGRARSLQDRPDAPPESSPAGVALRRLFGALTRISREHMCDWIDALSRRFSTDWPLYVEWHQATLSGHPPRLAPDQVTRLWHDLLRRLENPDYSATPAAATALLLDAREELGPDDEALIAASKRFGDPLGLARNRKTPLRPRTDAEDAGQEVAHQFAPEVLEATRGRRVLLLGGQGAREPQRAALVEAMQLGELDWETSERGQAGHYDRIAERVRHGTYDFILFLSAFSSHKAGSVIADAKRLGVPVVYLSRGYGLATVEQALSEQLLRRAGNES